jgi:ELWxxDGT repeat protein
MVVGIVLAATAASANVRPILVGDFKPGPPSSRPAGLTKVGGRLYFVAHPGHGPTLFETGRGGTHVVLQTVRYTTLGWMTNVAGTLYYVHSDRTHGQELWTSDGTADGTVMVKDIEPGAGSSFPHALQASAAYAFFVADDGVHGNELWRTDGTPDGTQLVRDLAPGANGSAPCNLTDTGERLFFSASNSALGREIWSTSGPRSDTRPIDLDRSGSSQPAEYTRVGGTLYFTAGDPRSDGSSGRYPSSAPERSTYEPAAAFSTIPSFDAWARAFRRFRRMSFWLNGSR